MSDLDLLKSGGYCFCVKFDEKDEEKIRNYLKENNYKQFHLRTSLPRGPWLYINYDNKVYVHGIIGVMVLKPIGRCIISTDEFLTIASIFDKKRKVW